MTKTTSEAQIRALVAQGKKFPEIAEELGVNVFNLRSACCVLGIKSPTRTASAHSFYEGIKAGLTVREIAAEHDVSATTVTNTLRRAGLPTSGQAFLKAQAQKKAA